MKLVQEIKDQQALAIQHCKDSGDWYVGMLTKFTGEIDSNGWKVWTWYVAASFKSYENAGDWWSRQRNGSRVYASNGDIRLAK